MKALGVVLFHTSSAALRAEKVLLAAGMMVKLIPTPRNLSSDSGISLQFAWEDRLSIEAHLAEARVEAAGIHPMP